MSTTCPVNCLDHPDDVDKINFKCVECLTNLEQACLDSRAAKLAAYEAKVAAEAAKQAEGSLTAEQIAARRGM